MGFTEVLLLLWGLALFLFGMSVMGDGLEKAAGNKLKDLLSKLTASPIRGFLLGLVVTSIIQSSSATTVMLVGFVNSGIMSLTNVIPIIMGANVGTTVTAWILSLTGISGDSFILTMLKPSSFTPIIAVAGVVFYVFMKNPKRKDVGLIMLGFATLIFGMDAMSDAVSGLKDVPEFRQLFTMFTNPILGVIAGAVVTGIIQSSSASVGILQALSSTGQITFGSAIPIIMGQNIGTCVTALLASVGTNKSARRVAVVHLSFNIIGTTTILIVFYSLKAFLPDAFAFTAGTIDGFGISIVHTIFNLVCTALLLPFAKQLEKIACFVIPDKEQNEKNALFDDRLLATPAVAIDRAKSVAIDMADVAIGSLKKAFDLFENYDKDLFVEIEAEETAVDKYEDKIGSYLLKITSQDLNEKDSQTTTKLLKVISDLERISDHAVNVAESAKELHDKSVEFSSGAKAELKVVIDAVKEICSLSLEAFKSDDHEKALKVESLEEVVDSLQSVIRVNHITRLKNNECTVELGFVLNDVLTNLERIADHCSNIADCVEMPQNTLSMHKHKHLIRTQTKEFDEFFTQYLEKYSVQSL